MDKVDFIRKYHPTSSKRTYTVQEMLDDLEKVILRHRGEPSVFLIDKSRDLTDEEHEKFLKAWQEATLSNKVVGSSY